MKEALTHEWVTVAQAAAYMQVCTRTVHRWIQSKTLPANKTPAGWRIAAADIERFMEGA